MTCHRAVKRDSEEIRRLAALGNDAKPFPTHQVYTVEDFVFFSHARHHKAGVDCIKVHRAISRAAYLGAVDECKKLGLPLVGHIPNTVTPLEASNAGQASIEHVGTLLDGTFSAEHKAEPFAMALERFTRESAASVRMRARKLVLLKMRV